MSPAEASERQAREALKKALEGDSDGSPSDWDGNMDSYAIGVIELLASGEITFDQARQALVGDELGRIVWTRFGDLADAYLEPCGQNPQLVWEKYKDISKVIASHRIRKPTLVT